MAIEDTGLPSGAVGAPEGTGDSDAPPRAPSEEFRLRLDSPLFHRDLGMSAASRAPQLRELTWEHVVRPASGQPLPGDERKDDGDGRPDVLLGLLPVSPASTPTIESLLGGGREDATPSTPTPPASTQPAAVVTNATPTAVPDADVELTWAPDPADLPALAPLPTLPPRVQPQLSTLASVLSNELPVITPEVPQAPAPDPVADQMLAIIAEQAQAQRDDTGQTRRPDTMVNDLAALIVNNTPIGGQARIAPSAAPESTPPIDEGTDEPVTEWPPLSAATTRPEASAALLRALEALDEGQPSEPSGSTPVIGGSEGITHAQHSLRHSGPHGILDSGQFERVRFDHTPSGSLPVVQPSDVSPVAAAYPASTTYPASTAYPESTPIQSAESLASAASPVSSPTPVTSPKPSTQATVEAELNRLAFLPDQEDEVGPVVVPAIAHSDQSSPPAMPSLSQHEMYQPRQVGPIVSARTSFVDVASTLAPVRQKRKRGGGFGRLLSFILLLGLLGGAVFAAKYYLLDPRWTGSVEKLAADVESARGLKFDHALTVTALPVDEYVLKLANEQLGVTAANEDQLAATWRAVGLLNGVYNANALGMSALTDAPAFYDAAQETIFVAQGLPTELYTFAMHRALTLGLLDQHYGFTKRASKSGLTVAVGMLALYDGDALATATALADGPTRSLVLTQIYTLHATYSIPASPSPYLSTIIGRSGVALMPYVQSLTADARDAAEKDATITDGQALDLRRLVGKPAEAAEKNTGGMLFWYHALAARLDNNQAWQAALAWQTDTVSSVKSLSGVCVVVEVVVSGAPTDAPAQAFQAWAAAAPAAAGTQLTSAPEGANTRLGIHACDPGAGVPTNDGHSYLVLGGAPLRAQQFLDLVRAQPTVPAVQLACAVYGGDPLLTTDERGVIDGADVWGAPATHPPVDPNRLGCAPAPA